MLAGLVAIGPSKAQFVPGISDLPVADGLTGGPEAPVVFDTPAGRIVTVSLYGRLSKTAARAFYNATLPQLGWVRQPDGKFRREGEVLKLAISQVQEGRIAIRFSLVPVPRWSR